MSPSTNEAPVRTIGAGELARRRAAVRRWTWALGAAAVLLYVGGFFVSR